MFIPLGTDRPLQRPTVINHVLIAVNLVAFGACVVAKGLGDESWESLAGRFGLVWIPAEPWRFVTYTLLHDGPWHIAGNMLFLWVFGASVEDRLGRWGYALLYLAGGVGAGAAHAALSGAPMIGASGAVAAVSGAFLIFFPRTNIRTLIIFFIIGVRDIPASWFIAFAVARDFLLLGSGDNVARVAHLGGYGVGIAGALALLAFRVLPRERYDALSLFKHGQRRREIRAAAEESRRKVQRKIGADAAESAIVDAVAEDRAAVSVRLGAHDFEGAMAAYRMLLDRHPRPPGAACLSRRYQLEIANAFFNARDYTTAMAAYERFLDVYPRDPEIAHVKLLMGLIAARYLHQPDRAKTLIADARPSLRDEEQVGLAARLLADLGSGVRG